MLFKQSIQLVQNNSRLHCSLLFLRIYRNQAVQVFTYINYNAFTNCLTALGCACTAHGHRYSIFIGNIGYGTAKYIII